MQLFRWIFLGVFPENSARYKEICKELMPGEGVSEGGEDSSFERLSRRKSRRRGSGGGGGEAREKS